MIRAMKTQMIVLPFVVASLLFSSSTHINASTSPGSSSPMTFRYPDDGGKGLSDVIMISHHSKKGLDDETSSDLDDYSQPPHEGIHVLFCQKCLDLSAEARRIFLADAVTSSSTVGAFTVLTPSEVCRGGLFSVLGEEHCLRMAEVFLTHSLPHLRLLFLDEDVCSKVGICPAANNTGSPPPPLPPGEPAGSTEAAAILQEVSLVWMGLLLDGDDPSVLEELGETRLCTACRLMLSRLRTTLRNPMTQAVVLKILLQACTMANRRYIRPCKKLVAKYGPVSVVLLTKFVNVVDLCNVIHFCQLAEPQQSEEGAHRHANGADIERIV